MIDRRTFIAMSAALPLAPRLNRLDLPDLHVDALDLGVGENVRFLGISPDATKLVGENGPGRLCFFDIATYKQISITEELPEIRGRDPFSLQWNPSGTKLAFSMDSWIRLFESDIFVVDVETGELTNLTPEGVEDEIEPFYDADFANLDMHPVWLDDETILFVRHIWSVSQDISRSLVTINLNGGEVENWSPLLEPDLRFVMGPVRLVSEDTVIFAGDSPDNRVGLYSATKGEAPTMIDVGEVLLYQLVDANESHSIVFDGVTREMIVIPHDDPTAAVPLRELLQLEREVMINGQAALGPTPGSFVAVTTDSNTSVVVYEEGKGTREIAYLRGTDGLVQQITWLPDAIFIFSRPDSWLIKDF